MAWSEEGGVRSLKALIIVTILLLVAGSLLLYGSQFPGPAVIQGVETFQIPEGSGWHSFFELEMLKGGHVALEYTESSDGAVNVFLLTEENYGLYQDTGRVLSPLEGTSGSTGIFGLEIPSDGIYYLIFEHGRGFEASSQDIEVTYSFAGLRPSGPDGDLARWGFVLVVGGLAFVNAAGFVYFRGRKLRKAEPGDS